jgi:hypothetical protein
MRVRKLGTWLAVLAIALQAAWPLVAAARPRAVALVPLCTVDGVTHYLEVPAGKTPLDESAKTHGGDHCAFCFLGAAGVVSSQVDFRLALDVRSQRIMPRGHAASFALQPNLHGARAPPFPLWLMFVQPTRGNHETAFVSERHCAGAVVADPGACVLRLGVLYDQHQLGRARRVA